MARRILIIEDDQNIANFVKINFELEGFETIMAFDGEEAIKSIDGIPVDLAILDLMIPKKDGWEVLEYIKGKKRKVPVIITSAKTRHQDIERGLSLGVVDYVTKPFDPADLVQKVKKILGE